MAKTFDAGGELTPEAKQSAVELMEKVAHACKDYDPVTILLVLETALGETIGSYSAPLRDLFLAAMDSFKAKAAIMLTIAAAVKGREGEIREGVPVEEILRDIADALPKKEASPEAKPASNKA